ncbi:MAG TPA: hypothetical protein VEQ61_06335, partial [Thermoleophilaceae bacterium]|nr:hypothetical protein [Thermoleophilaceae bacterium]
MDQHEPASRTPMIALVANERSGACDPPDLARRLRGHGAEVEQFSIEQATLAAASGAERLVVAGG